MLKVWPVEQVERIRARLEQLYGARAGRLMERLALCLGTAPVPPAIRPRRPHPWDASDSVLITYADSIVREDEAPLRTLDRFAREHLDGAIRTLHLLPFFPFSSDDGFAVIDYREVNPAVGTWADVERIGEAFDLMFDLVLNHVSARSAWFRDFRRGIAPGRDYFFVVEPGEDLHAVVRPRSLPLTTEVNTPQGLKQVWTTFSPDQVDLDFANPDVLFQFIDILLMYLSRGARILRFDAIAYLWKERGTPCIHLPQTHEVVRLLRDVIELADADGRILTETNVPHEENISYFGDGDEAHIVYQFSLPPLLLHALHTGTGEHLTRWAAGLAEPPPGCTFLNFTASHDGIGVRPLQGLVPDDEIDALCQGVVERGGQVSTRDAGSGVHRPYELNITYFDALADAGTEVTPLHEARFLCSQTIAMSLRGIPAVYLHSLTATRNDYAGVEATGRARSINRKQWDDETLRGLLADPASTPHRVFNEMLQRLRTRAGCPAFHPDAPQAVFEPDSAVFAFRRGAPKTGGDCLCIANLTASTVEVNAAVDKPARRNRHDLLAGGTHDPTRLALDPYQVVWLTAERKEPVHEIDPTP